MTVPAQVKVAGTTIRASNWNPIIQAIQQSCSGQMEDWFATHSLIMTWVANPKKDPEPVANSFNEELLAYHNQYRKQQGLVPLQLDTNCIKAAQGHSDYMARTGRFSHDQPGANFTTRLTNAGARFSAAGENIALGFADPASVTRGWMDSPGHKANILSSKYNRVGFGLTKSGSGKLYWTADFIKSSAAIPALASLSSIGIDLSGPLVIPGMEGVFEDHQLPVLE